MTICTCGMGPIGGCRVCDAPMPHAGDTPEERAAFLKWWEGQAHWSGSPCAVAYLGWLARATMVESARDTSIQRQGADSSCGQPFASGDPLNGHQPNKAGTTAPRGNAPELTPIAQSAPATRSCTCHPADNPPRPCPRKYAINDCRAAAALSSPPGGTEPSVTGSEFTCPQCGSHYFGTAFKAGFDWSEAVGHCHGYVGTAPDLRSCRFSWKRTDDATVFRPLQREGDVPK
jgi:hypothetical protein